MKELIFGQGDYNLVKESGIGANNTPWTRLAVESDNNAKKHVIKIELHSDGIPRFDGNPVHYTYTDVSVNHGMRSTTDTLEETQEYINALTEALAFARRVEKYILNNEEWQDKRR